MITGMSPRSELVWTKIAGIMENSELVETPMIKIDGVNVCF
jgi:hypothetical protein